jgi:hypothetical protein
LIKEFVALDDADEISVEDISSFLLTKHSKLVEIEKRRLFHNAIADIARDVLKTSQESQQMMLPGFPAEAYLPARVSIRSKTKNGKPIWKKPISLSGFELYSYIEDLKKPARTSRELLAMEFLMAGLNDKLGEAEAQKSIRTYADVMGLKSQKKTSNK